MRTTANTLSESNLIISLVSMTAVLLLIVVVLEAPMGIDSQQ